MTAAIIIAIEIVRAALPHNQVTSWLSEFPLPRTIEIRTYQLKPGMGAEFDHAMREQSLPMLARWKVDVVACCPSRHDADSYSLIRAYASLAEREASQEAFYASAEWREGPRESVLAMIDHYTTLVVDLDDAAIAGLKRLHATT